MLAHADVLMLQPPEDVAVYYAAAKTLALVSFIHFAIAATTAHRLSTYHANGDHDGLLAPDRLIRIGPGNRVSFAVACTLEAVRRAAVSAARSRRDRLRQ